MVAAISRVAKSAQLELMCVNALRAQAELMAPYGGPSYALIEVTAATAMAQVLTHIKDH